MAKLDSTIVYGDLNTTVNLNVGGVLNTTANLNVGGNIFVSVGSISNFGGSANNQGRLELNLANAASPQIGFTDNGDVSWAIGADDGDNSFKIHGNATASIPIINNLASPFFEIATTGIATFANCICAATPATACDNNTVATTAWVKDQGYTTSAAGTNITISHATTSVTVNSSTGSNGTINAATASLAGVVTNGTQTFGGTKTTSIWCGTTCVRGAVLCSTGDINSDANVCAAFNLISQNHVCVGGIINFCQGGSRTICVEQATDGGAGDHLYICAGAADDSGTLTAYNGGCLNLFGGRGSAESWLSGSGGGVCICGGVGGNSDCCSSGGAGGDVYINGGAGGAGFFEPGSPGFVYLQYNDTNSVRVQSSGICVYGTTYSPVICATTCVRTAVNCATTCFVTLSSTGYRIVATSSCGCAVDWVATSDCRKKKNIVPITSALSTVDCLCGVCYDFCDEGHSPDIGLIAQDVIKVEPRLVTVSEPDESDIEKYGITDEVYGLKYDKFAGLFVEAIKELKEQNICLQNQINVLREKLK